jgi:hypothetical protein
MNIHAPKTHDIRKHVLFTRKHTQAAAKIYRTKIRLQSPPQQQCADTPSFQDCPGSNPYFQTSLESFIGTEHTGANLQDVAIDARKIIALSIAKHNRPALMSLQFGNLFQTILSHSFGSSPLASSLPPSATKMTTDIMEKLDFLSQPINNECDPTKQRKIVPVRYYNTTIIVKIVFSIYYYLCFQ